MDEKKNVSQFSVKTAIDKIVKYMSDDMKANVGESCPHAIQRGEKGYCYPCIRERYG